jgi:arabinogalactan endo-1,4-beta-galactosidase
MVVETGYPWSTENFDPLGNIVTEPDPEYLPMSPEKQLEYMVDYTRAVMQGGGIGVIFWEPAWVSTPCRTPWGQGSSHDHLVFFDPENTNFMENGGGRWTEAEFYESRVKKK